MLLLPLVGAVTDTKFSRYKAGSYGILASLVLLIPLATILGLIAVIPESSAKIVIINYLLLPAKGPNQG